ncbi:hypothetical protein PSE10B_02130 [Pseudomonas amygdali pv. eriobotryae]|nr:hypothetical protein PSE10B_02130 [Pseudomonas amygdali pv. eriobotryae]
MGRWSSKSYSVGQYTIAAWEEQWPDGTYREVRFCVTGPGAQGVMHGDLALAMAQAELLSMQNDTKPSRR